MIAIARSLPDPRALSDLVRDLYGLEVRSCTLLRSLTNDVYRVVARDGHYALKVYGATGWSTGEVVWEQEFARHLEDAGIAVASVVPLADGRLAGDLTAPEGTRAFALTRFVVGEKPQEPFDDALYRAFGSLTARMHVAGSRFTSTSPRRALDRATLLDEPLDRLASSSLADAPTDHDLVRRLGAEAGQRVDGFASRGRLRWGIRHGDVTLDNLHRTDAGLVLHDFDLAAPGWLAADLTGVRATPHWDAFRAGYLEVADLTDDEVAALPWFGVIERISNLAFHLIDKPAMHGSESICDGWAERELIALREAADRPTETSRSDVGSQRGMDRDREHP